MSHPVDRCFDRRRLVRRRQATPRHPLRIFSGSANRPLAQEIADQLGVPLGCSTTTHLPDSKVHVQIDELVRDQDIFIVQPCSAPVNDTLMELLLSSAPAGSRHPLHPPRRVGQPAFAAAPRPHR